MPWKLLCLWKRESGSVEWTVFSRCVRQGLRKVVVSHLHYPQRWCTQGLSMDPQSWSRHLSGSQDLEGHEDDCCHLLQLGL